MVSANDFFPRENTAEWKLVESSSQQEPVFSFRARQDGDRRLVELDSAGHRFNGFFDRMTITPLGLELNRIHFANRIIDIPPWLLTLGPEPDRVDNVLPSTLDGFFGMNHSPYTGVTTGKTVTDGGCWTIGLKISAVGDFILKATLRLAADTGLCEYRGQTYGSFFFYFRRDDPGCAACS
jgi:hypothetical protein